MVYNVERDACDKFRDDSNGPITAFIDRAGVVNFIPASNTFVSVRSYGSSSERTALCFPPTFLAHLPM